MRLNDFSKNIRVNDQRGSGGGIGGGGKVGGRGRVVPELVAALAAHADAPRAVDDVGFAQAALDLRLSLRQQRAEAALVDQAVRRDSAVGVQEEER